MGSVVAPEQGLEFGQQLFADAKILKTRQDVTYASGTPIGYIPSSEMRLGRGLMARFNAVTQAQNRLSSPHRFPSNGV